MPMTPSLVSVMPSPGVRVTLAKSLNRDLSKVSEWCDLWGMKLNASKTRTMMVTRSRTMYPQSPPLTIGRSLMTLMGVAFDSKITYEMNICSVSRAASQRINVLRKSCRLFND